MSLPPGAEKLWSVLALAEVPEAVRPSLMGEIDRWARAEFRWQCGRAGMCDCDCGCCARGRSVWGAGAAPIG